MSDEPLDSGLRTLVAAEARPKTRQRNKPKRPPRYAVVLHNDDVNGFDFVVQSLRKVFGYSTPKAFRLTQAAHVSGRSVVWTGLKEHAELKAEQIHACGADPVASSAHACSLQATVEPLDAR